MWRVGIMLAATILAATGCVSSSKFDRQVAANEKLTADHAALYAAQQQLLSENVALSAKLTAAEGQISELQAENQRLDSLLEQQRQASAESIARMKGAYDQLMSKMHEEIKRGEITISELEGRLTVNMVESILFPSGSAEIKQAGREVLGRVAEIVGEVSDKDIQVEGHTDNVPISSRLKDKYPSNWELSTARAATVVRLLADEGIDQERLSASGFGEFRPIASNETAEGRAQNRRIQIVLVPQQGRIVKTVE